MRGSQIQRDSWRALNRPLKTSNILPYFVPSWLLLSLAVLIVPDLVGFKTTIALKLSSIVLLSVYIVLSFEMVHRTAD